MSENQQSTSPANSIELCTPSDSTELALTRGISFSSVGTLRVLTAKGEDVIIPAGSLAAGVQHALCVTKIFFTGTTVADIVLYR